LAGMDIVLRDSSGKIKQDLKVSRDKIEGRIVEVDKLKAKEIKVEKIKLEKSKK
jgi:hypothetical protein